MRGAWEGFVCGEGGEKGEGEVRAGGLRAVGAGRSFSLLQSRQTATVALRQGPGFGWLRGARRRLRATGAAERRPMLVLRVIFFFI